ncbi:DUF167 domain-containing protein [Rhodobacterales bacterium HKCCSP123]|nr:DUF167 domain-containing protein [Rhodobacterales bacterium HKCCSP123]
MKSGLPDLSQQAQPGAEFQIRATPKASRNRIEPGEPIRIHVTAAPDKGAANAAILDLLARSLGVAKSRLTLLRGQTSRDKVVRLD